MNDHQIRLFHCEKPYCFAGYGDAWSQLSKTIVEEDDGVTYVCEIDVGAVPAAVTKTMVVRLGNLRIPLAFNHKQLKMS